MIEINSSVRATLRVATEIEVVESFDEASEVSSISRERFSKGESVEFTIFGIGEDSSTWDIQFGDGSCAFAVPASIFSNVACDEPEE